MTRYFISGHGDLTTDEFEAFYIPALTKAIESPDSEFLVGDFKGADTLAQAWLKEKEITKVKVYHMFTTPRNNHDFETVGSFLNDIDRDAAMTLNSDEDICFVRNGREQSGAARNILRRKRQKKEKSYLTSKSR